MLAVLLLFAAGWLPLGALLASVWFRQLCLLQEWWLGFERGKIGETESVGGSLEAGGTGRWAFVNPREVGV